MRGRSSGPGPHGQRITPHSRSASFSHSTTSGSAGTGIDLNSSFGLPGRSSLVSQTPMPGRPTTSSSVTFAPSPQIAIFSPSHSDPSGYTPRPFDYGSFASSQAAHNFLPAAFGSTGSSVQPGGPMLTLPARTQDDLDVYNAYIELTRLSTDLGNTPYTCPYCDKSFGRSDVRAKHVTTMHADQPPMAANGDERGRRGSTVVSGSRDDEDGDEDDEEEVRPRKAQRTTSSANLNIGTFAQPAMPVQGQNSSPIQGLDFASLPGRSMADQSTMQPQWLKSDSVLPNLSPTGQLSLQGNLLDPTAALNNSLNSIFDNTSSTGMMMPPTQHNGGNMNATSATPFSLASGGSMGSSNGGFLDPNLLHVGSSLNAGHDPMISGNDLFEPMSSSWPVLNNVFGWGMSSDMDMDLGLQLPLFNQHVGANSSTEHLSAAWLMSFTPQVRSPAADGQEAKEEQERQKDPFGRNHEDPWPSYFKPVMPDRPLTLGGVKARPRQDRPANTTEPPSVGVNSRNAMLSLVYLSHQTHWMMPDIQDFPDADTLSDWVDLYFENFHPSMPILHRATWKTTDVPAVLMMAVAGIGATYADDEFKPITVAIGELVRRMVQWLRASDQRSKFDNNVTLAYLLQVIAGMSCGSRELMLHTEISRASLVTSLRRLHLLRPGRSALEEVLSANARATADDKWKAWLEDEGRRRFGWSLFLLDQQSSSLLDTPAVTSIGEARVSLPSDERLWDAPDARSWEKVLQEIRNEGGQLEVPFLPMLRDVLNGGSDLGRASPFSRSIIAHTIYRLSHDAQQMESALVDSSLDKSANLEGYSDYLSGKPYRALHNLALASTPTSVPSHLQICSAALYHHSRIGLSRAGLLMHAKAASGKFEPDVSKPAALKWLQKWVTDRKEVRRVLWHAGVLNALLSEFPRGHYAEPFWAFDCALIFWVIIKYGQDSIHSSELKSALFAANWFDVDPPNMWLTHGGQIFLPFLGSSTTLKIRDTLEHFIRQMGVMPWGLAAFQKQVLTLLLDAEDDAGCQSKGQR